MPEPVTLVLGGLALYAYLKGSASVPVLDPAAPASSTGSNQPISGDASGIGAGAPLETFGSAVADEIGAPLTVVNQQPGEVGAIIADADQTAPPDLVAALDNDTALAMRAYAALNPDDFAAFLDRYSDRIVLRNDMIVEALTNPPEAGFELSPKMLMGLGNASYKVLQALNGVSVGRSVDIFGVGASVAGSLPGINQDFVSSLQAAAMGYRALTSMTQVMAIAAANQVGVTTLMSWGTSSLSAIGAYPGLAALPMAGVLMAVGLVVDIGFTILGNKPDLQKAIDVALDVASLAVLFIPVIGVVIAIVIQLVKFIIDLFGEDLFGGGMSHEQREVLETARYGENLNPMFKQLADSYTPRELWRTIVSWGSGYCGGTHVVAMSVTLVLHAGDTFLVGGQPYTVPPELDGMTFGFGDNEQPGGCYWIRSTPLANITNDEQAWLLGALAPVNGVKAMAQAGIIDWRKEQFNDPTERLIMTRATPMRDFLVKHRLSLDQVDQIALEYRAQPHLNALAESFGWPTWQEFFAWVVEEEWEIFNDTITHGTLTDFARAAGFPTMYAYRASALSSYEAFYTRAEQAGARLYQNALDAQRAKVEADMWAAQQGSSTP